jgi:hypothetical protein
MRRYETYDELDDKKAALALKNIELKPLMPLPSKLMTVMPF